MEVFKFNAQGDYWFVASYSGQIYGFCYKNGKVEEKYKFYSNYSILSKIISMDIISTNKIVVAS